MYERESNATQALETDFDDFCIGNEALNVKKNIVFLFGESDKGEYCTPTLCSSLIQLFELLGDAPKDSQGIRFAIQFLSSQKDLIFFRIEEEGFSRESYSRGFQWLKQKKLPYTLSAICLPGVGDAKIIEETTPICKLHRSLMILSEKDLYDYFTSEK